MSVDLNSAMNVTSIYETSMSALGSKATYTGATMSIMGWVMSSEFGILIGIVLGVAGFIVNWYYRYKQDKREQELFEQQMKKR